MNYWRVNLLPFVPEERNDEAVWEFQNMCLDRGRFGMGYLEDVEDELGLVDRCKVDECLKTKRGSQGLRTCLKHYMGIKAGDLVIMRLKNAHYYVGEVQQHDGKVQKAEEEKAAYYLGSAAPNELKVQLKSDAEAKARLSWVCNVKCWYEIKDSYEVPAALVGKRLRGSINQCDSTEAKLFQLLWKRIHKIADDALPEDKKVVDAEFEPLEGAEKEKLDLCSFARALNWSDLEDLVAEYICGKHPGYHLLPSSCKRDKAIYEFDFVASGHAPITCQVKNQQSLPEDHFQYYVADAGTVYEKIYLFSGLWGSGTAEEQSMEYVEKELSEKAGKCWDSLKDKIILIPPEELFEYIQMSGYLQEKLKEYYRFD